MSYGKELIVDVHNADPTTFCRPAIRGFMVALCERIDMTRADLHFWDFEDDPEGLERAPDHLAGTSVVQFIETSNVTLHALNKLRCVYVNVFSCKPFVSTVVENTIVEFFGGEIVRCRAIERK